MAAFQQALANYSTNSQDNAPSSSTSVSIRGSANGGAPSTRGISSALRGAGITREQGMELDGTNNGGRVGRGGRRGARSGGPLDQARGVVWGEGTALLFRGIYIAYEATTRRRYTCSVSPALQ
uniref:Uncharacterized protein n=1 Tax=Kwoniella bestiolae CBS 10118 TaxID=1296100 RepID=A0A1B9FWM9_9TREE|nr:hypothetical protein I302_07513 [Kwoniella bestiolae CBS 10118]OCF23160.1 hypothetical protein I302_07513 [Kwoniella bestiolae CBS 10118]